MKCMGCSVILHARHDRAGLSPAPENKNPTEDEIRLASRAICALHGLSEHRQSHSIRCRQNQRRPFQEAAE